MITDEEAKALIAWAEESYRENGCTAWGLLFDQAMRVARRLHHSSPEVVKQLQQERVRREARIAKRQEARGQ